MKVAVLSGPPTCPEHFAQVYALETRMSWVFPTDTHACKLKKPARRDCPDFSAIELRHMDRETEVTLNQPPARTFTPARLRSPADIGRISRHLVFPDTPHVVPDESPACLEILGLAAERVPECGKIVYIDCYHPVCPGVFEHPRDVARG